MRFYLLFLPVVAALSACASSVPNKYTAPSNVPGFGYAFPDGGVFLQENGRGLHAYHSATTKRKEYFGIDSFTIEDNGNRICGIKTHGPNGYGEVHSDIKRVCVTYLGNNRCNFSHSTAKGGKGACEKIFFAPLDWRVKTFETRDDPHAHVRGQPLPVNDTGPLPTPLTSPK